MTFRRRSISGLGLLLVLIGVVMLGVALSVLPASAYRFWPVIFILVGVLGVLRRPGWVNELDLSMGPDVARAAGTPRRFFSWFLIVLGVVILPFSLRLVDERVIGPGLLVALGLLLIWRRAR